MRAQILELLRSRTPEPVSGEEISSKLGVSRTAIWKHIQTLKNLGYEIESVPKKGYILRSAPDLLSPEEIVTHLHTEWVGHHIHYMKTTNSPNEVGKKLAADGCADGMTVVAEEQTSGKGRLARGWFSPYGRGVWVSVVLKPPFLPEEAPKCTLMAAVAVVKAINKYKGVHASIKWPNDILLEGRKMVGILTEMSAEFGKINYIVIGTGINTNVPRSMVPDELKELAISVADVAKEPIHRVQILADYLKNLEELYETACREGFGPVFAEWRKYSNTIGQAVKVMAMDKTYYGTAVDIDDNGLLIVKRDDGTLEKVIAGDVSIRPANAEGKHYS